mmetsp:Transcript_79261/g.232793  ORF Transcript_79261/g.232793 Transcript_79261/m.232793 type:complete len:205 (+) Transcript_79261:1418-2032(+)
MSWSGSSLNFWSTHQPFCSSVSGTCSGTGRMPRSRTRKCWAGAAQAFSSLHLRTPILPFFSSIRPMQRSGHFSSLSCWSPWAYLQRAVLSSSSQSFSTSGTPGLGLEAPRLLPAAMQRPSLLLTMRLRCSKSLCKASLDPDFQAKSWLLLLLQLKRISSSAAAGSKLWSRHCPNQSESWPVTCWISTGMPGFIGETSASWNMAR